MTISGSFDKSDEYLSYKDYFTDEEVTKIDGLVADTLSPTYGYERPPSPDQAANG